MSLVPASFASVSALVRGAEAHLRSAGVFNDLPGQAVGKRFGRQPAPGKPPGAFGQWYVAIYWGGGTGNDPNPQGHDTLQALTLTLTARLNYAPQDRQGVRLTTPGDMYDLADALAGPNVVHGSWGLIAEANKLIPGTREYIEAAGGDPDDATVNGFVEPLVLVSAGPERPVSGDWVGSKEADGAFAIDIKFNRARRIQYQT
jgi:hypothetical protein